MTFLRLLFWDWRGGRVGRPVFAVCSLAIWAALYGSAWLLPSPLEETPPGMPEGVQVVALVAVTVLGLLALIASLNLAAKRFRDMGAPGWLATLGVTVLNGFLIVALPGLAYPWCSIAFLAVLALTPSGIIHAGSVRQLR